MRFPHTLLTLALLLTTAICNAQDPATQAYEALKIRDYDKTIELFRQALTQTPKRTDWRKQLAYTLLRTGDTVSARDEFAEVIALDPTDTQTAMEYAYLCHETRQTRQARAAFDRIRKSSDPKAKDAEQAFQNIDRPLAAAIARYQRAIEINETDHSAHADLAHAAEDRGDVKLAARHYLRAWQLKPGIRDLLVDYGRMAKEAGQPIESEAAFLAASRSESPRAAETARGFLPNRYPYAGEFRSAIQLDPGNALLRRELGFLLLATGNAAEGEAEFENLLQRAPDDLLAAAQVGLLRLSRNELDRAMPLLEKVLKGSDADLSRRVREALDAKNGKPRAALPDRKKLGDKSYEAGHLADALRYYLAAREDNPNDPSIDLKLGYTYNMLKNDSEAVKYFEIARHSEVKQIRSDANRAYHNLKPALQRFRTTIWALPIFSSRWHEAFSYGQIKTDMRIGNLPLRPYVSVRFVGDSQRAAGPLSPGYLSESSFIAGAGLATTQWKGLMAWAEAGNAVRYRERNDIGRMTPDYRGGVNYARSWGTGIKSETPGFFYETSADAVYLSRFHWNSLFYSQNKVGYTRIFLDNLQTQAYWNSNITMDRNREPWANFMDQGPGFRFRLKKMPPSMVWSIDLLRGAYLIRENNPRKPVYYDIRIGVWYAATR